MITKQIEKEFSCQKYIFKLFQIKNTNRLISLDYS